MPQLKKSFASRVQRLVDQSARLLERDAPETMRVTKVTLRLGIPLATMVNACVLKSRLCGYCFLAVLHHTQLKSGSATRNC